MAECPQCGASIPTALAAQIKDSSQPDIRCPKNGPGEYQSSTPETSFDMLWDAACQAVLEQNREVELQLVPVHHSVFDNEGFEHWGNGLDDF